MQKIIPHLWFNTEAKEATAFYTSLFPNSAITKTYVLKNTPSGDVDVVAFTVCGYELLCISAGPYFKLNPSISLMVNFDPSQDAEAATRIDSIWEKLVEGGKILMPLQEYPFSKRYGWVEDRFGVSWQLILTDPQGEERPIVIPAMLFVGDVCGKSEEASDFYLSIFKDTKRGIIAHYPAGTPSEKEENVMFTDFKLQNQWFAAMDSSQEHNFKFNEAFSFIVNCDTQEEIDYYWEKLSAVPESEQCGWLKDKYGVSWQIVPSDFEEVFQSGDEAKIKRVTDAFMQMKKFDIATLERAAKGE